jgi:hypothetical protein
MVIGYPDAKARLAKEGVVVLDILQEVNGFPCDIPTYPPSAIASSLGGIVSDLDFSGLSEGYASKKGIFDPENVEQRAAAVRKWLLEREEDEIIGASLYSSTDIVVAHGDILRQIVDGSGSRRVSVEGDELMPGMGQCRDQGFHVQGGAVSRGGQGRAGICHARTY